MRVLLAGGTGLIGHALVDSLRRDGHEALVLSRRPREQRLAAGATALGWDARSLGPWVDELARVDAVVQLAGEPVLGRWTTAKKARIRSSRVESSALLARGIAAASRPPGVLVQASAVGYYGDTGEATVSERTPAGDDFLARVCVEWEAASAGVESLGVRRPLLRTGIVLSRQGGALPSLVRAHRFFAGGRIGSGRQWMPWIHQDDEVEAIRFLLGSPAASGPFNLVAPAPVRNAELGRAIGRRVKRPSWLPVPELALRLVVGELAGSLLAGQRALPERLVDAGYRFRFPALDGALADLLA